MKFYSIVGIDSYKSCINISDVSIIVPESPSVTCGSRVSFRGSVKIEFQEGGSGGVHEDELEGTKDKSLTGVKENRGMFQAWRISYSKRLHLLSKYDQGIW